MDELDDLLLDSDGRIKCEYGTRASFDELPEQYDSDIDTFYHGTTEEAKASILENGFDTTITPKSYGCLDGAGGVYFTTTKSNKYGDAVVTAKFNGNIALADTNVLQDIKTTNSFSIREFLQELGGEKINAHSGIEDNTMMKYIQQKISDLGYQGILGTDKSIAAGCRYFQALDASLIEIIS